MNKFMSLTLYVIVAGQLNGMNNNQAQCPKHSSSQNTLVMAGVAKAALAAKAFSLGAELASDSVALLRKGLSQELDNPADKVVSVLATSLGFNFLTVSTISLAVGTYYAHGAYKNFRSASNYPKYLQMKQDKHCREGLGCILPLNHQS